MNAQASKTRGRGTVHRQALLARHCTWRTGGPADELYIPSSVAALSTFLANRNSSEPLTWLGLGSNVLVRDGGVRGTVILTTGLKACTVHGSLVAAEAGIASPRVARISVDAGLSGAEFLSGIPGTLGGALAMNAGAFGRETWEIVEEVDTMDRHGRCVARTRADFAIGYRCVTSDRGEWFVGARLRLVPGVSSDGRARIQALLARRAATQPTKFPNAGSVFRNPPNDHAARLIEASGLKGLSEGGARVSALHANFIINEGHATSADIERLIARVQETVWADHGVMLEREVRILGDPA